MATVQVGLSNNPPWYWSVRFYFMQLLELTDSDAVGSQLQTFGM